jgi:hypothetical protein
MKELNPSVLISLNRIGDQEISTVLLYRFDNEPRVWETCVFKDNGDNNVVARYNSESEAIRGHNQLVERELMSQWDRESKKEKAQFARDNPELVARWKREQKGK